MHTLGVLRTTTIYRCHVTNSFIQCWSWRYDNNINYFIILYNGYKASQIITLIYNPLNISKVTHPKAIQKKNKLSTICISIVDSIYPYFLYDVINTICAITKAMKAAITILTDHHATADIARDIVSFPKIIGNKDIRNHNAVKYRYVVNRYLVDLITSASSLRFNKIYCAKTAKGYTSVHIFIWIESISINFCQNIQIASILATMYNCNRLIFFILVRIKAVSVSNNTISIKIIILSFYQNKDL